MPPGILRCNSECPIHPKTAIFNRPIQGGFAHQKRYARVQPGHSVVSARDASIKHKVGSGGQTALADLIYICLEYD